MPRISHAALHALKNGIVLAAILLLASGCTTMASPYQPDFEVINTLKDLPLARMQVGGFVSASPDVDKVGIRGGTMESPYANSYSSYLRNALIEELKQSALWDENSAIVISGELLQNDVDISGFKIGTADLSARFRVDRNGTQIYEKVHSAHHQWQSSFVANVAVPNALNNYPIAVQRLIDTFLLDVDLLRAVTQQR